MNVIPCSPAWNILTVSKLIALRFTVPFFLELICWVNKTLELNKRGAFFLLVGMACLLLVDRVWVILTTCRSCSMWSDMLDFTYICGTIPVPLQKNKFAWDTLVILHTVFWIIYLKDLFYFWGRFLLFWIACRGWQQSGNFVPEGIKVFFLIYF